MKRYFRILFMMIFIINSVSKSRGNIFSLSASDGLKDLVICSIYQDRDGYMWFGSPTTLERYDGVNIKDYSLVGDAEITKRINSITQTPDGMMWLGSETGLLQLDSHAQQLKRVAENAINKQVYHLEPAPDGQLFVGAHQGLFIWDKGKITHHLIDNNALAASNIVRSLDYDSIDNCLWLATERDIYKFSLKDNKISPLSKSGHRFSSIKRAGKYLYAGTPNDGLYRYDIASGSLEPYISTGSNVIMQILEDDGMIYVATDGDGVTVIDPISDSIVRKYSTSSADRIRSNGVYCIYIDNLQQLWIGLFRAGVELVSTDNSIFRPFGLSDTGTSRSVRSVYIDNGKILYGSQDGMTYVDESGHAQKLEHSTMHSTNVLSIGKNHGKYYIGTYGNGLYEFDPSTMDYKPYSDPGGRITQSTHIYIMVSDPEGDLWLGTSEGVFCLNDKGQIASHFNQANSQLRDNNVFNIFFDSSGKGWFNTHKGISLLDKGANTLTSTSFPPGFISSYYASSICETNDGELYFWYDKNKLFKSDLNLKNFSEIQPPISFDFKDVNGSIIDRMGYMWICTSNGLYRWNLKNQIMSFNEADGLPGMTFYNSLVLDSISGDLWLTNSKGLLTVNTADTASIHPRSKLDISDIIVDGKSYAGHLSATTPIKINDNKPYVEFKITDFNFAKQHDFSYQYRLVGLEDAWHTGTSRDIPKYYSVPSGKYTFQLRALNSDGVMHEQAIIVGSGRQLWIWVVAALCAALAAAWLLRRRASASQSTKPESSQAPSDASAFTAADNHEDESEAAHKPADGQQKYREVLLSADECQSLESKLSAMMEKDRMYLNPSLKLADVAKALDLTSLKCSYLFNQYLKAGFYDYINRKRVDEFKRIIVNADLERYTLSALAEKCGFSSRTSFFRYFKQFEGMTPQEYISQSRPNAPKNTAK